MTKHDEFCEADWGQGGQESPCQCEERERTQPPSRASKITAGYISADKLVAGTFDFPPPTTSLPTHEPPADNKPARSWRVWDRIIGPLLLMLFWGYWLFKLVEWETTTFALVMFLLTTVSLLGYLIVVALWVARR